MYLQHETFHIVEYNRTAESHRISVMCKRGTPLTTPLLDQLHTRISPFIPEIRLLRRPVGELERRFDSEREAPAISESSSVFRLTSSQGTLDTEYAVSSPDRAGCDSGRHGQITSQGDEVSTPRPKPIWGHVLCQSIHQLDYVVF
jgi:hypothetical protein